MLYNGNIELYEKIMAKKKFEDKINRLLGIDVNILYKGTGQIKTGGPPPNWIGPPPPKSWELFVGRIPRGVSELELWLLFSTIGLIYEQRLMIDDSGANNRVFAFVHYIQQQDADRAVVELNEFEIRLKHKIVVAKSFKSIDNRRLLINGIPIHKSHQELQAEMERLTKGVSKVIINNSNIMDKSKNRGFASVEYVNYRAAAKARRILIPKLIQLWGSEIKVEWAATENKINVDPMSKFTSILVRKLSPTTTEQYLWDILNQVTDNDVKRVEMMDECDFAFIHFTSHESAGKAFQALNGTEINGSKVEVKWANPLKDTWRKRSWSDPFSSVSSLNSYEPVAKRSLSVPSYGFLPSMHSSQQNNFPTSISQRFDAQHSLMDPPPRFEYVPTDDLKGF